MPPRHDDLKKPCWESFFSFEGDLKETGPPTMDYFHTQLFHKLSLVSKEKVRFNAIISYKRLLTKWLVPDRNTAIAFSGDLDRVWALPCPWWARVAKSFGREDVGRNKVPTESHAWEWHSNWFCHFTQRLHVDTDLDERVQYILKTYEYICKVNLTQNDTLFSTTCSF